MSSLDQVVNKWLADQQNNNQAPASSNNSVSIGSPAQQPYNHNFGSNIGSGTQYTVGGQTTQNSGYGYSAIQTLNAKQKEQPWTVGMPPTTIGQTYAAIKNYGLTDPAGAQEKMNLLGQLQATPGNQFYNAYAQPSNSAVNALRDYGLDTSLLTNDWFNSHPEWQSGLIYNGTTNTPTKPGKKATTENWLSYYLYQYYDAMNDTSKAQTEWQALQEEVYYWASCKDLNLSDDEILSKIDWDKYKTLDKMDSTAAAGKPMELNEAVGYSKEALLGVIWAGRNDGGTGNQWENLANYYLGEGNKWQYDEAIAQAKQDSPYSVSMTLNDMGLYFGVRFFTDEWVEENKWMATCGDETMEKNYITVAEANKVTKQSEAEREDLLAKLDAKMKKTHDDQEVLKYLDTLLASGDYKTLNKMDQSIADGYGLVGTTRPIDYSRKKMEQYIRYNLVKGLDLFNMDAEPGVTYTKGDIMDWTRKHFDSTRAWERKKAELMDSSTEQEKEDTTSLMTPAEREAAAKKEEQAEKKEEHVSGILDAAGFGGGGGGGGGAPTDQQAEQIRLFDGKVREAFDLVGNLFTDVEHGVMNTFSAGAKYVRDIFNSTPVKEMFRQNLFGTTKQSVENLSQTYEGVRLYDQAEINLQLINEELKMIDSTLDATDEQLERINALRGMVKSGNVMPELENIRQMIAESADDPENDDGLLALYQLVTGDNPFFGYGAEDKYLIPRMREWAEYIFDTERKDITKASGAEGTLNTERKAKLLQDKETFEQSLEANRKYMDQYDTQMEWLDIQIRTAEITGADIQQLKMAKAIIGYLGDFAQYTPTEWKSETTYETMRSEGKSREEIDAAFKDVDQAYQAAMYVQDFIDKYGIQLPENILNNYKREVAMLEREEADYKYFQMQDSKDFKAGVEKGKEIDAGFFGKAIEDGYDLTAPLAGKEELVFGLEHALDVDLMHENEKEIYYYLLGTQGFDAAYEYYDHLTNDDYGILTTRGTEEIKERARAEVDAGFWSGAIANIKAVISAPVEGMASLGYMINRAVSGKEFNPDSSALGFGHYSSEVNAATVQSIADVCGGQDNLKFQLVNGLYEIFYNRGRSMANSMAFGFLTEKIGMDVVKEIVGALPMAFGAAGMAVADAKERGASDGQAWCIGMATLVAESFSEGLTYSNIMEAFGKAASGEVTGETIKGMLMDWLGQNGFEEMFGETMTEIAENFTDTMVMGELSEHNERINNAFADYKSKHPTASDEEAMKAAEDEVGREEMASLIHTMVISYLSPGADLIQGAAGYTASRLSTYKAVTKARQQSGHNENIIQVAKMMKEVEQEAGRQNGGEEAVEAFVRNEGETSAETLTAPETVAEAEPSIAEVEAKNVAKDSAIIESLKGADAATQNQAIVTILSVADGTYEAEMANAAAPSLLTLLGGDIDETTGMLKRLLAGAYANGTQGEVVKAALMTSALSAHSRARAVITSQEFQNATPEQQAEMLANTRSGERSDNASRMVAGEISQAIQESKVAAAEAGLYAEGALDEVKAAQETADKARENTASAQRELDKRSADVEAKGEAVKAAGEQAAADPSDENTRAAAQATDELNRAMESEGQYEQHLEKAQADQKTAEDNAEQLKQSKLAETRQQAMEIVAEQDRQAAERQAQEAEAERVRQEQEEQRQAAQIEEDNASYMDREAWVKQFMANHPEATEEDIPKLYEIYDSRVAQNTETQEAPAPVYDEQGQLTPEAKVRREKFINGLKNKYGIEIEFQENVRTQTGKKANGYFDPVTGKIILDVDATADDAMYLILGHEITHLAEKAGRDSYVKLASSLLSMRYGSGADYAQALANLEKNGGRPTNLLEADIADKAKQYREGTGYGDRVSYEYALQEIVADTNGMLFQGDERQKQELVDRLVKEDPGTARRILDSIKRFIKQALGMKGAWLSNAQQTVDMLDAALTQATNAQQKQEHMENLQKEVEQLPAESKFQLADPVERTDNGLVAMHNLSVQSLGSVLGMRGIPMPSIAVVSQDQGWGSYGEVSIIFDRFTADPGLNPNARLYGGDAYTPTLGGFDAQGSAENALEYLRSQPESDTSMKNSDYWYATQYQRFTSADQAKRARARSEEYRSQHTADEISYEKDSIENPTSMLSNNNENTTSSKVVDQDDEWAFGGTLTDGFKQAIRKGIQETMSWINSTYDGVMDAVNATELMDEFNSELAKAAGEQGIEADEFTGITDADELYRFFDFAQKSGPASDMIEAKPNEVVGFEHVKGVIVPEGTDQAMIDTLEGMGIPVIPYEKGNEDQRLEQLNNFVNEYESEERDEGSHVRFSLADENVIAESDDGEPLATELRGGTVAVSPDAKYSLSSFNPEERRKVREALLKAEDENGNKRFTEEQVDKYLTDAMGLASMIAADRVRLDFEVSDPEKSMVKSNSDYGASIDASTLCAKRLVYQGTFDAIQHALPNTPLMPEDLIRLSDMMREMGYETPCGICYVESRRRNLDKYIAEWLKDYKGEYVPTIAEVSTTDGLEEIRKNHRQTYDDFMAAMNSHGKQNNPKPVQLRTEYKGEIRDLSDKSREKFINHGGIRLQSFSDFETPHLLDMVQVVMDIASKGLTSQAYTKVPNFAWVFGDTGIKINLSLIGKGEGVDENGNLIFDDVEGMPFEEAMKLRDRYSKNVGTILVGINDKQILAAMADPRIDYIIPFHSSGWTKDDMRLMHTLENYKDYQNYQTEKDLDTGAKTTKNKGNNIAPVGEKDEYGNGYWDFNKSGKENAETYLDLCYKNRLVPVFSQFLDKDENGHYHLKPDGSTDGYWKMLVDFKMYENGGDGSNGGEVKGAPQLAVTPDINMNEARRVLDDYRLYRKQPGENTEPAVMKDNNSLPVAKTVVDQFVKEYKANHPLDENRTKYSLPEDAPYMAAVERGETDEAQRMVDEKADEAGYVNDGYHGTLNGGFTIFDKQKAHLGGNSGAGFYFSSNPDDSEANYSDIEGADNHFKVEHLAEKIQEYISESGENEYAGVQIPEDASFEDIEEIAKKMLTGNPQTYHVRLNRGRAYIRDFNNSTNLIEDVSNSFNEGDYNRSDYDSDEEYEDAIFQGRGDALYEAISNAVYNGISDVDSNFEIISNVDYESIISDLAMQAEDYGTLTWDDVSKVIGEQYIDAIVGDDTEAADATTEITRAIVEAFGFDSIEDREVGKKFNQLKNMGARDTVHYIMFRPEQIKLADPVTYDKDGNVIPLSERFKANNPDIRYSLPSDDVIRQDLERFLANGGSLGTQDQYARPLEGENPAMTMATDTGDRNRGFVENTLPKADEFSPEAKWQALMQGGYFADTNPEQMDRAIDWIRSNRSTTVEDGKVVPTSDGFYESMAQVTSDNFDYRSADGQARMVALMGMAVAKGDTMAQVTLADAYNRQGTDLGRALQARKIFRLMTPEGRVASMRKLLDNTKHELAEHGKYYNLKFSDWIYDAVANAQTEEDYAKVMDAAYGELAEQIPADWKDRVRTWRMLSMLANPRTHFRNLYGNAAFVPVVGLKNIIGTGLESIASKTGVLGHDLETRTKSIVHTEDSKAFAKEDAKRMQDVLTGENKYGPQSKIKRKQKAFGQGDGLLSRTVGKGVQAIADFNSDMLEKEDWIFLNMHYQNALAGYMTANGLTSEDMTGKTLENARTYAVLEAQKATYRDANKFCDWLNSKDRSEATKFAVDAIVPFKKTPANILRRGIEYSPIGLLKSLATAKSNLDAYAAWQEAGSIGDPPKGAKSVTQVLDNIAAGLSGTAVAALGALLYSMGHVKLGFGGDDDDELAQERGSQEYSIEFFGKSFTIDWAAPVCMPFFTGASLYKTFADQNGGNLDIGSFVDSLTKISEPVFNLSMLDGFNSLLKTIQGGGGEKVWKLTEKVLANYAGSMVPSFGGAIARTVDTTRRQNYVESGASMSVWQQAREQAENKIPFLSMQNIPYRNVWGETDESPRGLAFLENFILPGYVNDIKDDVLVNELQRVYDATGDSSVIPKAANKKVNQVALNDKQYDQYRTFRGQTAKRLLTELINKPEYIALSENNPEAQVQLIGNVWDYVNQIAKHEIFPDAEIDKWVARAYATDDPIGVIFEREEEKARSEYAKEKKADLITSINQESYTGIEASIAGLREAGKSDSDIRSYITSEFKPIYKQAVEDGDDALAQSIMDTLTSIDLGSSTYKEKDIYNWLK